MVEYSHVDEETKWFTYNEKVTETYLEIKTDDLPPSANLVFRVKAVAIIDGEQNIGKACDRTAVGACVVAAGSKCLLYSYTGCSLISKIHEKPLKL